MFEPETEAEARIMCRLYLWLFEAGPHSGGVLNESVGAGGIDPVRRRLGGTGHVLHRALKDDLFDSAPPRGGVPHYALPPPMRERMTREFSPGTMLAERIRGLLQDADRGETVPTGTFQWAEQEVRTGFW